MAHVALIAPEVSPWSKVGGLGDVCGALPRALIREAPGWRCSVWSPAHRSALPALREARPRSAWAPAGRLARWWEIDEGALRWCFYEQPELFDREGVYGPAGSAAYAERGYPDNAERFGAFCQAVVQELLPAGVDLLHLHDWPTALVALLTHGPWGEQDRPPALLTLHNARHRGRFDLRHAEELGLADPRLRSWAEDGRGQLDLLLAGLRTATALSTVSEGYAAELQSEDSELGPELAGRSMEGITNGIDTTEWDPRCDPHIAAPYGPDELSGKALCRTALLSEMRLTADPGDAVLAVVSRLDAQKGLELVAELAPRLASWRARLILLGEGDPRLQERFQDLALRFRHRVAVRIGFDVPLAHRITAGADLFLMPSRFEPCGLHQMYAMAYGTPPVARAVGGLRDTIDDPGDEGLLAGQGTGFLFDEASPEALGRALGRALQLWRRSPEGWQRLQRAGMERDHSWTRPVRRYLALYQRLLTLQRSPT